MVEAVTAKEEQGRLTKTAQRGVQGTWTRWEEVDRFMISSTFDVLPSPVNFKGWGMGTF